jgi:hypothetical protein
MPRTYEPIASTTLGSDAATYTFSSVPSTYTDLILVAVANNATATIYGLRLRVGNGSADSGSNYSCTILYGDGSSAVSERYSSQTAMFVGNTATTSGSPAMSVIHIMSYANTNVFKTALNAGALAASNVNRNVNLWRSTSAIDTLTVFSSTGDLKSGSTFALYGVKAA